MQKALRIATVFLLGGVPSNSWAAFTSTQKVVVHAIASVNGGTAGGTLTLQAPSLPSNAFFGKDAVIPLKVISTAQTITTQGLRVEIGYQLVDVSSQPIGSLTRLPVQLVKDPRQSNALVGQATIPQSDLINIQRGGRLVYYFRAEQATGDTVLAAGGLSQAPAGASANALPSNPFNAGIIQEMRAPVKAQGSLIDVPDLSLVDGDTTLKLGASAISGDGTVLIRQLEPSAWPAGPKGAKPLLVYSLDLEGTTLTKTAEVSLSYSASVQGKVSGTEFTGEDLALFFWDGFEWRLLDRPRIDTTLRTVTATTNRMATFALLPVGAISAADIRPRERIVTPNGDGINDTALFSGLTATEDVKIFDIRGHKVRTLGGPSPSWDGRNDDGGIVESGVYLYQYVSQGERVSGVIAVAK